VAEFERLERDLNEFRDIEQAVEEIRALVTVADLEQQLRDGAALDTLDVWTDLLCPRTASLGVGGNFNLRRDVPDTTAHLQKDGNQTSGFGGWHPLSKWFSWLTSFRWESKSSLQQRARRNEEEVATDESDGSKVPCPRRVFVQYQAVVSL
jgi:hypothetical protein